MCGPYEKERASLTQMLQGEEVSDEADSLVLQIKIISIFITYAPAWHGEEQVTEKKQKRNENWKLIT